MTERRFYANHAACVRAARRQLGFSGALEGRDFKIIEGSAGFTWRPTSRPIIKALVLLNRPHGATADEIARKCGWQRHTAIRRISWPISLTMKIPVEKSVSPRRGLVYRVAA